MWSLTFSHSDKIMSTFQTNPQVCASHILHYLAILICCATDTNYQSYHTDMSHHKVNIKLGIFFFYLFIYLYYYTLQPLKAYCAIWIRRSNFRHRAPPRISHESTQQQKMEMWARNVR
jgi:hypothetical protein